MHALPATLRHDDLADELAIIKRGVLLRGFTSSADAVERLRAAGLDWDEVNGLATAVAIAREYKRQIAAGERTGIVTTERRPGDWQARYDGHQHGDALGMGSSEIAAILDLVRGRRQ